jgi:hypothetical protein
MSVDYGIPLLVDGPVAHGHLISAVYAPCTVIINIPNVYAVNDMLAHPISTHRPLDNGCLQMSSELAERLRVNIL